MAYDGVGDLADTALVQAALVDAKALGVRSVVWSGGGEPTTHPEWQSVVEWAGRLGLAQGMYTHGGHLSEAQAALLAANADWVVISLDAVDARTYGAEKGVPGARFEDACNGVRRLAATGQTVVGVSFLLHAGNWLEAGDMVHLGQRLGATYVTLRPTVETDPQHPSVCTADRYWITEAEPLLRSLSHYADVEIDVDRFLAYRDWRGHGYDTCRGIRLTTTITPDGRVWLCPNRRGQAGSALGDLREESLAEIWARHPGVWTDFRNCRVMCRLHPVNQQLAAIEQTRPHEAFV